MVSYLRKVSFLMIFKMMMTILKVRKVEKMKLNIWMNLAVFLLKMRILKKTLKRKNQYKSMIWEESLKSYQIMIIRYFMV
jgi:hypothetical protein